MAQPRSRYCRDACALPWRRSGKGRAVCFARRVSRRSNRECSGQLHSGRAERNRFGRDQARRKNRLVLCTALSLFRAASAHRRQCLCLASDRAPQCASRLSLRQRLARPARCFQHTEQPLGSDHLCLRLAVEIGLTVRDVLPRSGHSERTGCCLPKRRDGPRAASGRAARDTPGGHGAVLRLSGDEIIEVERLLFLAPLRHAGTVRRCPLLKGTTDMPF